LVYAPLVILVPPLKYFRPAKDELNVTVKFHERELPKVVMVASAKATEHWELEIVPDAPKYADWVHWV
jgi:phosphatidylethanolamine-binding protein (PEBP) family uncharacterized protein